MRSHGDRRDGRTGPATASMAIVASPAEAARVRGWTPASERTSIPSAIVAPSDDTMRADAAREAIEPLFTVGGSDAIGTAGF